MKTMDVKISIDTKLEEISFSCSRIDDRIRGIGTPTLLKNIGSCGSVNIPEIKIEDDNGSSYVVVYLRGENTGFDENVSKTFFHDFKLDEIMFKILTVLLDFDKKFGRKKEDRESSIVIDDLEIKFDSVMQENLIKLLFNGRAI